MSSKANKKDFDQAAEAFKAAEANGARMKARAEEIGALLLQGRLAHSQLGTEIDRLAVGDGALGDELTKNLAMIRELSAKRAETEATNAMLERAQEVAGRTYAEAKLQIVHAETTARRAQAAYFNALSSELIDDFLQSNRSALQRILQVAHADGMHDLLCRSGYEQHAQTLSIQRLDNLFETVIAEAAARMTPADDEAFHSVVGETSRGDPPYRPLTSSLISSSERGRIRDLRSQNGATNTALLDALSRDDSPPPEAPMSPADLASARGHMQYQAKLAADARAVMAQPNAGLPTLLAANEDNVSKKRDELRQKAEHAEAIAQRWQAIIDRDEAMRA